jgi:heme-degrading monooxygenase HmoA
MKNFLKSIQIVLCAGLLAVGVSAQAQATKEAAAKPGVTIVQPVNMLAGKDPVASRKAVEHIRATIQKMPGFIEDEMLMNKNPANKPSHVHVMRWQDQKNWEAMFSNVEFQKAVKEAVKYVEVDGALLYVPVK